MAVSKLWPVTVRLATVLDYASNPEKTTKSKSKYSNADYQALRDVVAYAKDGEKTERELFCEGIHCNPQTAREQFITVKEQFDKPDGIQAYHGYLSFEESDIKGAYLKAKLGLNPSKKFEALCESERRKYFGNIRFDDEYVLSTSAISKNLLFIGLSKHLNYEFNWFDKNKYSSKKPFKTKVNYICSRLENGASVKINDDMKDLKCVKKLNIE